MNPKPLLDNSTSDTNKLTQNAKLQLKFQHLILKKGKSLQR